MEIDIEIFLDWLVKLDISFYETTNKGGFGTSNYVPSGKSHFYLKGSQKRFTSKEMIEIFSNTANDETNENWQLAIAENFSWQKRQQNDRF